MHKTATTAPLRAHVHSCKKVMLIDDKEVCNFIMKKNFSNNLPYFQVSDFTDAEEAFDAIPEIEPDIIFLDLALPILDEGWDFLERMEAHGYSNRVVILSTSTSERDHARAKTFKNVVKFVSKPLFGEDLRKLCLKLMMEDEAQLTLTSA